MAFQITRPAWAGAGSLLHSLYVRLNGCLISGLLLLLLITQWVYAAPPVARNDNFTTGAGQQVTGLLSSNDESLDGPADSYALLVNASNGTATVFPDGSFSYSPNIGFAGTDTFTYSIDDGAGGTSFAVVSVAVEAASDFISSANPVLFTLEDTQVALGLQVAPDLYDGGALQDLIDTDAAFRSDSAGGAPVVSSIPSRTSSIAITGYSTQSRNTAGDDLTDDDYQLLNARINLVDGTSSGRVAFINNGRLSELDQYAWMDVPLGQPVLADTSKVVGFHATGASNPTFSVVADTIQIVETHTLETAYVIEYMTSEDDSTNFLGAGNTVQTAGESLSVLTFPSALEPGSGKKGFIALNALSAAAGSNFAVEHKGFARLLIDLEARSISGTIAAQRGENSANTVTYSFDDYPLIDQRTSGAVPVSILGSSATRHGDVTADASVLQNPTLYIDSSGQLVIERASGFSGIFTSMYTAEYYERTGFSSIASFVSVGSADALFDDSPADGVDEFGDPVNEFMFTIPASARVGLLQMSWDTIGGSDTNENMGMGFAVIDLENGISSGSITFIRTSSPDLLSWDGVPFGQTFFGATDGGNALYQSNKSAGSFTDQYPETAQFIVNTHPDGSRTLTFTATSSYGTQNYRDYRGNANISWLGNEPFTITGVPTAGLLSHGAPNGNGGWEIDFADLPILAYLPAPHESGTLQLSFDLSSTGESEKLELRIEPVVDTPALSTNDSHGYVGSAMNVAVSVSDSADVDGSENQSEIVTLSNVPSAITFSSTTGTVTSSGGGVWLVDRASLSTLMATSTSAVESVVTASITQIDQKDVDGDLVIEDGDNGNGVDEVDELTLSETFTLRVNAVPTVTSLLVNNGTPMITGTASPATGETLEVTVNGVVYTDSGPHLVLHGDGSWTLTIPPANVLPENTYAVTAVLSHVNGSMGSDTTSDELIVDLTPPPIPGITSQTTMDDTPLITGTLAVATGNTLRVSVNGQTYTQGDGQLNDNGDGTWQLQIPAGDALADSMYQVTATLTDAAGNVSTDNSVDELLIDTLSPPSPGVTSQSTSDSTPVIEGTATLSTGDTLTVEVDGIVYVAGAGPLVDNADGTWTLTIPAVNELVESVYDVVATVTDTALNASSDPSSSELTVDLTAPAAPAVTAQLTNQPTPVMIGTASVGGGETLSVTIAGVSYTAGDGHLTDNGDGTWALSIPPINALSEGVHEVIATVTDAAGNSTSDSSSDELEVDLTPPPIPTVSSQLTASDTPVVTGTANTAPGDVLSVEIGGILYIAGDGNLVDNGDGTWVLTIPVGDALTDGSYDVLARVTDAAGNVALDASSGELVVDLTPPPAPGVTSQTTSDTTPLISGTTEVATGLTLRVTVNGVVYVAGDGHLIDNGDGTWDLTIPPVNALVDALYQVVVTLTDAAGNVSTDAGVDELLVDTTAPPSPGVTSLTTNDTTPVIQGTAVVAPDETLTVLVNSVLYTAGDGHLIDQGDGTWTLTIPPINILADGSYDVTATVTDAALNTSVDPSNSELLVDTLAPASPTVVAQVINDTTPTVQGTATVLVGETLSVLVNGISYTAGDGLLVDNGDGTWELLIPAGNALPEGVFDVVTTVTDAAGNSASDSSVGEIEIDLTPPATPAVDVQLTNSDTPVVTGTAVLSPDDTLSVVLNGVSYTAGDGVLIDNGDGTWELAVPAGSELPEGAVDVSVNVTDAAGNSASDTSTNEITVDLTPPPAPGVTSQTTADSTPVIEGTTTIGTGLTLRVTVDGVVYVEGDGHLLNNGDGTWALSIPLINALSDALYQVEATLQDAAGNISTDTGTDELLVDTLLPQSPGVTSLTTNDTTPVIVGTATVGAGESLTVSVNGVTYSTGDGFLVDAGDGTWSLTIPAVNTLAEANYDVVATVTDAALNSSSDPSSGELTIDLTAPVAPTVDTQLTNSATPTLSGTATLVPGETLSVMVNGITYTDGDGDLVANPDGTWTLNLPVGNELPEGPLDIAVTATDVAGNSASDASVNEVFIDLTAPNTPTVIITSDVDNNGLLSLAEPADPVDIRVTLSVDAETGDRLDLTDGNTTVALTLTNADVIAGYVTTQFARPLEAEMLSVVATLSDRAGNISLPGNDSALVDTVPPLAPVVSVVEDTDNNATIGIAELLGDINIRVYLPADAVAGDALKVTIDGAEFVSVLGPVNITAGSVNFVSTAVSHGSSVAATAFVTDVAGNESLPGSDVALLDLLVPAVPVVNALISNTGTPTISGTVNLAPGESMTVTLNGRTYVEGDGALQILPDGRWIVAVPVTDVLMEGVYDLTVTVTDLAGNSATDTSSNELNVDLASPAVPTVNALLTNASTPTITGTATLMPGETLSVTINGVTYTDGDGHLVANPDGSWTLTIPQQNELPDDTYPVTAVVTDSAGNSTSSQVHLVQIDTTSPDITAADVQSSTTFRPVVGGSASLPDGAVVRVTDADGNLVCEATVAGGAWSCIPDRDLPEGDSVFTASSVDEAGNTQAIDFLVSVSSDFDADGIPNVIEGFGDSDGDGVVDSLDLDSDNDGLPDRREGSLDTDGDGLADYLDQDADNDGIADTVEALGRDENGDYLVDQFVDTDGNGLSDPLQSTPLLVPDTDGDGIPDFQDIDSDQDGIPDIVETLGSDLDDDGRVDGFLDNDVNGVDDGLQLIRVSLLDTDGDGLPDYRDLDSDNDGIMDLVEVGGIDRDNNGIVDSATDINGNGIPDSVDVLITLGQDVDGDGIDDIADASVSFGDDTDGDGILDAYDPDIDGDGRADTAVLDLILGAAVPDTDLNGTPNFQQAIDGTLRTGLSGRGGCSIKPGTSNSIDPVLLVITCLALLGLASRSRYVRRKQRAMHDDASMAERAEHVRVIVALVLLLAASFVSANGLQLGPYIGLGVGQSLLKPDASELSIELVDETDRAFSGVLGLDLTKRFAVEFGFDELGRARLTNDVDVDYQLGHASLLLRGFNDEQSLVHHRGTSLYGRLGLGRMENHANFPYVREHDMHLMFGAGVEYGFSNGLSIRADLTTFDTDAHRAGVFVLYRPRFRSEQPEAVVADRDPSPTPLLVTREPDIPAPEVLAERKYFVLFDQNSSIVDLEAKVTAVNVAATMRLRPQLQVLLTGYADVTGSAHYNRWLADRRVNRVRSLLELRGVDSARIDTAVVGETAKFSSSDQSAELRSDRRVQIEWVKP